MHDTCAVYQTSGTGNFEIKKMTEEDKNDVLELVKSVWGEDLTRSKMIQWEWLYGRNPNNPPEGPRAMIVRDAGKVVGLFRCIPAPLKIGNRYFINDWNVDLMIHPDYRGKRLALDLAHALLSEGDVNTGLPLTNSPTYRILTKLNGRFIDVAPFHQIIRPIRMHIYAKSVLKLPGIYHVFAAMLKLYYILIVDRRGQEPDRTLIVEEIGRFDSSFEDFWEKVQQDYPVIIKRDPRYLNWKFIERPDCKYTVFRAVRERELAGYVVVRSDERFGVRTGFIVDILTRRDDVRAIDALLSRAIQKLRDDGADQISAQAFFVATFKRSFRRAGFIKKPSRRVRRIVLTINNDSVPRDVLINPKNWFITRNYAHQEM